MKVARVLVAICMLALLAGSSMAQNPVILNQGTTHGTVQPTPADSSGATGIYDGVVTYGGTTGGNSCGCQGGNMMTGQVYSGYGSGVYGNSSCGTCCDDFGWSGDSCCNPCGGFGRGRGGFGFRSMFGGRWSRNACCCP